MTQRLVIFVGSQFSDINFHDPLCLAFTVTFIIPDIGLNDELSELLTLVPDESVKNIMH